MERTITVDGRELRLRSSAAIPRMYRLKFQRDVIQDITAIQRAMAKQKKGEAPLPLEALTLFENVAYLMAKHADNSLPDNVGDWLDGFETFSIYAIFPVIEELWAANLRTLAKPAKK